MKKYSHYGSKHEEGKAVASDDSDWISLCNVSNDIEFEILKGVLEMGGIPVIRKIAGIDSYLIVFTGVPPVGGIDVLVPEDRYEEARQLLDAGIVNEEQPGQDNQEHEE